MTNNDNRPIIIDIGNFEACLRDLKEGILFPASILAFGIDLKDVCVASKNFSYYKLEIKMTERTARFIMMWIEGRVDIEYLVTRVTKADLLEAFACTIGVLIEGQKSSQSVTILAQALSALYKCMMTDELLKCTSECRQFCFNEMIACVQKLVDIISRSPVEWTRENLSMLVAVLKVTNLAVLHTPENIMTNNRALVEIVHIIISDILKENHSDPELIWITLSLLNNNGLYVDRVGFSESFREFRDIFTKAWDNIGSSLRYDFGQIAEIKFAALSEMLKLLSVSGILDNEEFLMDVLLDGSKNDHVPAKNNAVYAMGQMFKYGDNINSQIRSAFLERLMSMIQSEDCVDNGLLQDTCIGSISRILATKVDMHDRLTQTAFQMITNRLPLINDPEENVSVLLLFLAAFRDKTFNSQPRLNDILQGCVKISTCRLLESNKNIQQKLFLVGGVATVMFPNQMFKYSRMKTGSVSSPQSVKTISQQEQARKIQTKPGNDERDMGAIVAEMGPCYQRLWEIEAQLTALRTKKENHDQQLKSLEEEKLSVQEQIDSSLLKIYQISVGLMSEQAYIPGPYDHLPVDC